MASFSPVVFLPARLAEGFLVSPRRRRSRGHLGRARCARRRRRRRRRRHRRRRLKCRDEVEGGKRGRDVNNYVNKLKKIIIIHYLLVDGNHSGGLRALAIWRSCENYDENYVCRARGSILHERCRCMKYQRIVICQPCQCR